MSEFSEVPRSTYSNTLLQLQARGFLARTIIDTGAAEGAFFLHRQEVDLFPGACQAIGELVRNT